MNTEFRRQINLSDGAVTRKDNYVEIDMSGWTNKPSVADWTNYVRVYEHTDSNEVGVELTSQTIDSSWGAGNHDVVCFIISDTSTKSTFTIYYGETDLGAPGYSTGLTGTADTPDAGDYQVRQDSYYTAQINNDEGGGIGSLYTRVSGADVSIGRAGDIFHYAVMYTDQNGTGYYMGNYTTPTITVVENGAVCIMVKVQTELGAGGLANTDLNIYYRFCNCQLIHVRQEAVFAAQINNLRWWDWAGGDFLDDYFSHQSYKYSSTHVVETRQTTDLSVQYANKKYSCYFDTTSDDGIAIHYEDENYFTLDTQKWIISDGAGADSLQLKPDYSVSNTNYSAGTYYLETWMQIDDFTEADGLNDTDGDQPAHRKNDELLTALTQTVLEAVIY